MKRYRESLPQLGGDLFLADGGIETTLIFLDGLELPDFAAFHMLKDAAGVAALRKYFRSYAEIAKRHGTGLVLETATWRASADWAARLGYDAKALATMNRATVRMLEEVRRDYGSQSTPVVISGCVGPRGDGYVPHRLMTADQARDYHRAQIETFAATAADLVTALTMNYTDEALGIARAARDAEMPVVIAFTVETDGKLPTGQTLAQAIDRVDQDTSGYPAYYMINCAHPTHFEHELARGGAWTERIRGLRANASCKSHAELNDSAELDFGDPRELGALYARLHGHLAGLNVLGGCCGTDQRHIERIAESCAPLFQRR